jgi:dTDP-4-dehydrorhamnose 3,5-epimerase
MIFRETTVPGAFEIEPEPVEDERGWIARTFSAEALDQHGLNAAVVECSASFTERAGTLRGLHYQIPPYAECKLVRCTRGAVYDVLLDLRPDSPTYCRWFATNLTAEGRRMLYIPEGVAHGLQTLSPRTELHYQISAPYSPSHARGVRWDDPTFSIEWPRANERTMSDKDRTLPDFQP